VIVGFTTLTVPFAGVAVIVTTGTGVAAETTTVVDVGGLEPAALVHVSV
jgi:hypothetical protein